MEYVAVRRLLFSLVELLLLLQLTAFRSCSTAPNPKPETIYDALASHGLPRGILPKGVTHFSIDDSGRFKVLLDQACDAKFENELHYDRNVSGSLVYGQIGNLTGMSAQDLFLWFPVKEIRVDIPSSGLIYFDVGVVRKQYSVSSFETPRDCVAAKLPGDDVHGPLTSFFNVFYKRLEGVLRPGRKIGREVM